MPTEWLSLSGAAHLLGVHPSTVRSWSDQGSLPVHRTQGGHRRYKRSEVELWMQSQRSHAPADANLVVQNALRLTRFQISEGRLAQESWYQKLDDEARGQYRSSGRTLLQGLINSLNSDGSAATAEAEGLGYEYAARARRYALTNVEAVNAFLFFRTVLFESMLGVFEAAAVQSPAAWSELFRTTLEFTDRILITLMETYAIFEKVGR
jgi:excisionase family DNA binding protein